MSYPVCGWCIRDSHASLRARLLKECVDAWFADHTTCPSCRQNLVTEPESSEDLSASDRISEQYEIDPRFRFLTAFDGEPRRRHDHWAGSSSLGGLRHSHWNTTPTPDIADSSSDSSNEEVVVTEPVSPRFLGIRRFFDRRGHVPAAIPRDDEAAEGESIELV